MKVVVKSSYLSGKSKIVSIISSAGRGAVSAKCGRLAQGDKLGGGGKEGESI